jgi:sortase A
MTRYIYIKKEPQRESFKKGNFLRNLSFLVLLSGFVILISAFWPIVKYEFESRRFASRLVSPVKVLGEETTVVDYSRPSSWFPTAKDLPPKPSRITHYSLSIPKLKIEDAVVHVGGEDLMEGLIQYSGTALPGQYGNVVIFGHSVLPQFFNPKNYKTIFSTLPSLEKGDEILVSFDGILYRYEVIGLREVIPDDVSVLQQHYDSEYLSLITCVPPGTYLKRLVVKAKLVRI